MALLDESLKLGLEDEAPTSDLQEDLALDSLNIVEVVLVTEDLAGGPGPAPKIPHIVTLEDVYRYYCALVGSR
jgi:acyl carrier protein